MKIIITEEFKTVVDPGKGLASKSTCYFYVKCTDGIYRKATREDLPDDTKNYSMTKYEAQDRLADMQHNFGWLE